MHLIITTVTFYLAASALNNRLGACLTTSPWPCRSSSLICGGDLKRMKRFCGHLLLASSSSWRTDPCTALAETYRPLKWFIVHESFVDHYTVYETLIFGHAALDPHLSPLAQWRLSGVWVERCQCWALIWGICRRVEAVSGGWWELGEEVYAVKTVGNLTSAR